MGCFWVNRKGLAQKTHCFDNGADSFEEGLTRYLSPEGKLGYMNRRLKVVIPATYTFSYPFSKGQARACLGCSEEKEGEHSFHRGGEWFLIDKTGKVLRRCAATPQQRTGECLELPTQ
jgi:hypothetical protein